MPLLRILQSELINNFNPDNNMESGVQPQKA